MAGLERRAESDPRRTGDYLLLPTAPCGVALAASSVSQICEQRDWPDAQRLVPIEQLVGVVSSAAPGADIARRVLALGRRQETPIGITIPHGLSVLPATFAELLPLPELFLEEVFSAMLLWHGQPKALLIDSDRLRARTLELLARV